MAKKVAIVGAGASGLAAIKCCLEVGLEPIAFERDPWIGGLWRYTDLQEEDQRRSCVALSTITNTSKHMMCYSDFPMPKEWPNYLSQQMFLKYFQMYADHFHLKERIRFQTTVIAIEPCKDYSVTGKWQVHYFYGRKGGDRTVQRMDEFDFVMVCSGVNWDPALPQIPGLDTFSGEVLHSKEYRTWKPFEGKRVVVVGLGNTAGDVACELSRHASQVYLSTRSGSWVASRLADGGQPVDTYFVKRCMSFVPQPLLYHIMAWKLNSKFSVVNFGLETDDLPNRRFPVLNDELPHRIVTGLLQVKSDIAEVQERTIVFKDGSKVDKIDSIILATGYKFSFPVLSDSLLCQKERYIPLYKYVFPPTLNKGNLAIIGAIRVNGPVPPVVEMQARWAVRVFVGENMLPDYQTMMDDVKGRQIHLEASTHNSSRAFHLVSYIGYQDELATVIGAKPNIWELLRCDPPLAVKYVFGPCLPAQYRLVGPGAWKGAKDVLMSVQENVWYPLRTRKVAPSKKEESASGWKCLFKWVLVLFCFLILFSVAIF